MFTFFLGVPLTFGMISIADGLVPWFYGDGFEKVAPNIIIIAPIILIVGLSNVLGIQYLLPTQKQNMYFISVLSGALINVLLNIIFIPKLYSLGAAIASVIAELSVLIIQIIITRKFFDFICIIKNAFKYIVSGIIMFLTLGVLARFLSPGIKASIIQIAIGGCIYFGMLIVLKDEILLKIIKKAERK